jgi:hypothetical protein
MTTSEYPQPLDHTFTAPLEGMTENGGWTVVVMPGSKELFGTGRSVKVSGTIDGYPLASAFMPNGKGAHLIGIKAEVRKAIGKHIGDEVTIHLEHRLS